MKMKSVQIVCVAGFNSLHLRYQCYNQTTPTCIHKSTPNIEIIIVYIDIQHVHLLVSASLNQPANSIFLSQQTSTSQPKPAQKPTSEHAD